MFNAPYPFQYNSSSIKEGNSHPSHILNFTFYGKEHVCYVVEVEKFAYDFLILSFYLERDEGKKTKEKYGSRTNLFETSRVLATCLQIMKYLLERDPKSSFGFVGTPSVDDEKDLDLANTKRYRVYSQLMANVISPERFQHYADHERSMYLLINRDQSKDVLIEMTEFLSSRWNALDD